jgi:UDP-glucose:(heptosyl)LPS alpha-1,3-glucosyltransferase
MSQSMKLAFALFKYFPYGGLQRDCVKIAQECVRRGHQVDLFCQEWIGPELAGLQSEIVAVKGWSNYRRYDVFAEEVLRKVSSNNYDGLVGFNRMKGLDFYFGADPSFALKLKDRSFWQRILPRSRSFLRAEEAVYGLDSSTQILLLSDMELNQIRNFYGTPLSRFHLLPPGVEKSRLAPSNHEAHRCAFRNKINVSPEQKLLLIVGSGFRVKGVDRALIALSLLPHILRKKCVLMILGQDNEKPFIRQAQQLGIEKQVHFMGGRDDAADFMFAADLLIHPAYRESAGMILVEAIAARLPVLVTDTCGYSFHVANSGAGRVVASPFDVERFADEITNMLSTDRGVWRRAADDYLAKTDIFGMAEVAVNIFEKKLLKC